MSTRPAARSVSTILVAAGGVVVALGVAAAVWRATADAGPRPEPPRTDEVPQLAWFYKPPTDDTEPREIVRRSDLIVLTKNDESFLARLREAGWKYAVPQYVGLPWVRGPAGYERGGGDCRRPARIAGNSFAWFEADFCERLHPHEDVFLHRADGERLHRDPADGGGWLYAVDPASPTWRAFVAERVEQTAAGRDGVGPFGYDGLFLDEAWATRSQLLERYANADGTLREYATDESWQKALRSLIVLVAELEAEHGRRTWINTDHDETVYDDAVGGVMVENFAASWSGELLPADEQVDLWRRVDAGVAAGRQLLLVGQGDRTDRERMRYAYASYLMVAAPEVTFRYSDDPAGYRELWSYPEYDARLGAPIGARRPLGGNVWRRDFEQGTVLVNLAAEERDAGGVTLPARSGLLFLAG